jgi:large subunit ribosomal protein L21
MYAVIRTGGKQHKVAAGDVIEIELVQGSGGDTVTFQPLLVVDDEGKAHVGKEVGKAVVTAKLLGEKKGEKVKVFKYRQKTGYARKQGHRQMMTLVEIQDVSMAASKPRASAKKEAKPPKAEEPPAAVEEAPAEAAAE